MATLTTRSPVLTSPASLATDAVLRFVGSVIVARRQRKQLARLDAAQLRDIGLTRQQARAEAARAFWDMN